MEIAMTVGIGFVGGVFGGIAGLLIICGIIKLFES